MQTSSVIEYTIDGNDEIIFLSDSWNASALENDAPELVDQNVLNQPVWNFITDETTRQLYRDMLKEARAGKSMLFRLNCDSPDEVRLMEMVISSCENGRVLFQSRTLSGAERLPQRILDRNAERINELLIICSWCKAINTGDNEWQKLDTGITMLGLFEQDRLPKLSHGICEACYLIMSEKISQKK